MVKKYSSMKNTIPGASFTKGLSRDLKLRLLSSTKAKSVVSEGFTKLPSLSFG